jgi:PAS domain-containing protein
MSQDPERPGPPSEWRDLAEQRRKSQPPDSGFQRSRIQTERLVEELKLHEIELEMQNGALLASRAEVEASLERYTDLYDFAPVGYFTLAPDGSIRGLNLPGARLLGLERARLVGRSFRAYVSCADRSIFDSWLEKVKLPRFGGQI